MALQKGQTKGAKKEDPASQDNFITILWTW